MDISAYKNVFVFAEQREGKVQSVAFELLGKARDLADTLGQEVCAILLGHNIKGEAQNLIAHGADRVLVVDDKDLEVYTTEPYAQAITSIVDQKKPSVILLGATTIGRDLGPRVSARLNTGLTADCTELGIEEETGHLMMTRPAFGGNLMATIMCTEHRPQMSTVRPGVMMAKAKDDSRKGEIEDIKVDFNRAKFRVKVKEVVKEQKNQVDITKARVLVSGGRGVGNKEGFQALQQLAECLGGEVSSSRAMVDAGVMEHSRQVGQTGKTVRPEVYLALGISGAIQHLAGMDGSDLIIAVNKDKYAPIFEVADMGIVCDLKKVVPALVEKLKKEGR